MAETALELGVAALERHLAVEPEVAGQVDHAKQQVAELVLARDLVGPLELGLDPKGITLLALTLLVSAMSLSTGRTTVLQGAVHLVIFAFFLFTSFAP
jgi:Ca2+/H+ antiporter